jgi:hypothetical protein
MYQASCLKIETSQALVYSRTIIFTALALFKICLSQTMKMVRLKIGNGHEKQLEYKNWEGHHKTGNDKQPKLFPFFTMPIWASSLRRHYIVYFSGPLCSHPAAAAAATAPQRPLSLLFAHPGARFTNYVLSIILKLRILVLLLVSTLPYVLMFKNYS